MVAKGTKLMNFTTVLNEFQHSFGAKAGPQLLGKCEKKNSPSRISLQFWGRSTGHTCTKSSNVTHANLGLSLAKGNIKHNGSKSILEKKPPTTVQRRRLMGFIKQQARGSLNWRELQARFRRVLRRPGLGLHTVRRQVMELQVKHG